MKRVGLLVLLSIAGLLTVLLAAPVLLFEGADHSRYDQPRPITTVERALESSEHRLLATEITVAMQTPPGVSRQDGLRLMRARFDSRGAAEKIVSAITPVETNGVSGEWVIAPNADPERRLLYIHGGGFVMGSPTSHRPIASRLSEAARAAVFSVKYRLMPENSRLASVEDCQRAYRWLLENGPAGQSIPQTLIVAGDSAGGNLALATVAWARDVQLRAANVVVVFSPQTDATFSGPSHRGNLETDIMQRDGLGPVAKAPRPIMLWTSFQMYGVTPRDPRISPLFGSLSGLPPTLIQASESEMFLDDAVRYANKANEQGSYVVLQTWRTRCMPGKHSMCRSRAQRLRMSPRS